MIGDWVSGVLRHRTASVLGSAAGVAVTVGLLASVGAFVATAQSTMTARAVSGVPVDWQVQLSPGADTTTALRVVRAASGVVRAATVDYARVDGLTATTGGTTQQTAAAVVLGVPADYAVGYPGEVRLLVGSMHGAVVAQQTAANLRVRIGDRITIRTGTATAAVAVTGVVDLPQANSLFQTVGAASSAQPPAPPDNVVLLPAAQFRSVLMSLATTRPDFVTRQIHVRLDHRLPTNPADAYTAATRSANRLSVALAGTGQIGDNLSAALDAARSDAAYATLLFLFLGLPGSIVAALLTVAVAAVAAPDRRRDSALMRVRGAGPARVVGVAVAEAILVGTLGGVAGVVVAAAAVAVALGGLPAVSAAGVVWAGAALALGMVVSVLAVALPVARDARALTVAAARRRAPALASAWWRRIGLDVLLLGTGLGVWTATSSTGYSLVLAPEGVATIKVDYAAFVGPSLVWIGSGLLAWRLLRWLFNRRRIVAGIARPLSGSLAGSVASSVARQRDPLARAAVLLALTLAFATSVAVFDSTYQQQAEVDARLTNGADVRVSVAPGSPAPPGLTTRVAAVPGVLRAEPLQHRFAYVGADLQDLYGVRPASIGAATSLQDAYFQGGTASQLMARLARTPDGILVSAETATDYGLKIGDRITLRIPSPQGGAPVAFEFRYLGIAKEFPTAPKDSFLIANSTYLSRITGSSAISDVLVATRGDPTQLAGELRRALGSTAAVTPIGVSRATIGSSLTSVDLRGLTALELGFAVALAAASGGLVLALRSRERRGSFAVATLMGARRGQLRGWVLTEGVLVAVGGAITGTAIGALLSWILVSVLSGVFDPPPDAAAVPLPYLVGVMVTTMGAVLFAAVIVARRSHRPAVELLRED